MSLKPQPPRPMPPEMAAWGAKHLAADDPYKLIGDTLYAQYHDEDFADLYHKEGKPGLSPVLLAFVTIFQNLENLPDRKAAEAVEIRAAFALRRRLSAHRATSAIIGDASQRGHRERHTQGENLHVR